MFDHIAPYFPIFSFQYGQLKYIYVTHINGILEAQDPTTGMWHNILNDDTTFLETSASGMFTAALVIGMERGWIPKEEYNDAVKQAWHGIATKYAFKDRQTLN